MTEAHYDEQLLKSTQRYVYKYTCFCFQWKKSRTFTFLQEIRFTGKGMEENYRHYSYFQN